MKEIEANEKILDYKAYEGRSIELILDLEKEINQLKNTIKKAIAQEIMQISPLA